MAKKKGVKSEKKIDVKEISDVQFESIINDNNLVVVDFFAEWCMPCVMMVPAIDELAQTYAGKIVFVKINIDENHQTAEHFKVLSIPTLILFKKGKPIGRMTGSLSYDMLKEKVEGYLKS